jgi:hypothetical protein
MMVSLGHHDELIITRRLGGHHRVGMFVHGGSVLAVDLQLYRYVHPQGLLFGKRSLRELATFNDAGDSTTGCTFDVLPVEGNCHRIAHLMTKHLVTSAGDALAHNLTSGTAHLGQLYQTHTQDCSCKAVLRTARAKEIDEIARTQNCLAPGGLLVDTAYKCKLNAVVPELITTV